MRIGIDCRLWNQTGVGRYTRNLIINLLKIDNKNEYVLFIRSKDSKDIRLQVLNDKLKIVETNIKWHSIPEQIKFPQILKKENLDLMHFPYFSLPIFYDKPYVVTIHDLIINHFPTGNASTLFPIIYYLKLFAYKFIIYKAINNAKKIIVPSNATKQEIKDHYKTADEKIVVTHEAADENISTKFNDHEFKFKNTKYFLYVGNAFPHKNLNNLIAAFNKFSKDKDIKLILVGKKDYFYNRLENKAKSEKIIFYGNVSDEELVVFYKNALCLIMPSLMEGFGLPVLEAMKNNCLVAASDILSLREIARDNAIYFNPKSIQEINDTMDKVYFLRFDKSIITNANNLAKTFSWEKMAKQTLNVYESSISL